MSHRLHVPPGTRFGQLTIVVEVAPRAEGQRQFLCRCTCGKERKVPLRDLRSRHTKSCGCGKMVSRRLQLLPGTRVGHWTVLAATSLRLHKSRVLARCDCGTERELFISSLRKGGTKSCGCQRGEHGRTHAMHGTSEYRRWQMMIQRCHNPHHSSFKNYGARGIQVCERWRRSFTDFLSHVGQAPDGLTLDRINNDGHYEPGNVRWATVSQQNLNKRRLKEHANG